MRQNKWLITGIVVLLLAIIIAIVVSRTNKEETMEKNLEVTSSAFKESGVIPKKYSGEAEDLSPPLTLVALDKNAESIAIIMKDIDSPIGVITHWVMWNIPVQNEIPADIPKDKVVSSLENAKQGKNIMRQIGYMGPKPPWGTHRYVFLVYVLDKKVDLDAGASWRKLRKKMDGHILQYGTLTGSFAKTK